MARKSAGILLYRRDGDAVRSCSSIRAALTGRRRTSAPGRSRRGNTATEEDAEAAARREFLEETGRAVNGPIVPLGEVRQTSGKRVTAFAAEGDLELRAGQEQHASKWNGLRKAGRRGPFPRSTRGMVFPAAGKRKRSCGSAGVSRPAGGVVARHWRRLSPSLPTAQAILIAPMAGRSSPAPRRAGRRPCRSRPSDKAPSASR